MKLSVAIFFIIFVLHAPFVGAQQVEVQQISASPYERSITRVGKIEFKRTNKLSFKTSGYLTTLNVDEGDYFTRGDLLASHDTTELKALKNSRYSELMQAKREVNRAKKLIEADLSSQQSLDVAMTQVDIAREAYQIAYYNLEKAEIRAPFDGVVLARFAAKGELQGIGNQVLEVAAIEKNLIARVGLTFDEIAYVSLGQNVEVQINGRGSAQASVTKVPAKSNAPGNMFVVEATLEAVKVGEAAVAGQLAYIDIRLSSNQSAFAVPNIALLSTDQKGFAQLLLQNDDGSMQKESFAILGLDSEFIYLQADERTNIDVITQGWQQIEISEF